jgi:replicative DNA helicase
VEFAMAEIESHRLPPQNLEAEMSVLGAVLLENEALNRALETLIPDDFYRDSHKQNYKALVSLSDRSEPADLVTLTAEMKKTGHL